MLAMEGLNGLLKTAEAQQNFHHHWRCHRNTITNICFADDLLLFCRAEESSYQILKDTLVSFAKLSELTINHTKSALFFSMVSIQDREALSNLMGIQLQSPPVRYLGLPLITTRLTYSNCLSLINRITSRIRLWTSASLTYAGHLQLIKAVLFSIQVYWSTNMMLPVSVVKKIESIMASFLWKGVSLSLRQVQRWYGTRSIFPWMKEVWASRGCTFGTKRRLPSFFGACSPLKPRSGQHGFTSTSFKVCPFGRLTPLLIHPRPGGKLCKLGSGAEGRFWVTWAMVNPPPYGMTTGCLKEDACETCSLQDR